MSNQQPDQPSRISDLRALLDQALESERGLAVRFATRGKVVNFIQKLNTFRVRCREDAKGIYPPDNPMYGQSPYEALEFRHSQEDELECHIVKADEFDVRAL